MRNTTPLEEWEQVQYFRWVYSNQVKIPELELINGSMNGVRIGPGTRAKLKGQGLRSGFPDIDVPVKRFPYGGLRIELKRLKGGRTSEDQKRVHKLLRQQGYRVEVCRGWREAVGVTKKYLGVAKKKVENQKLI